MLNCEVITYIPSNFGSLGTYYSRFMVKLTVEDIISELGRYVELSPQQARAFLSRLEPISFAKRDVLIRQGTVASHFYWIREGCTMAFYTSEDGQEHVMQFAVTHWWTTDLKAFFKRVNAELTVQALSQGEALALSHDSYESLLKEEPVYERYFRQIFANALIVHQRRIMRTIGADAEAHYKAYLHDYPGIDQWVPQKYIASYLGITPEFLSKLRRRLVKRTE